jgi:phosphatidylglycerophosphatase C
MMAKKLLLLDFDGTITTKDTFPLFIKFNKGYPTFMAVFLMYAPLLILYKLKVLDGGKLKQHILRFLYKGCYRSKMESSGQAFIDYLHTTPIIKPEFGERIKTALNNGNDVAIVSASPDTWIKPFADKYGLVCLCTELAYDKGCFSGFFASKNCVGHEKVVRIKAHFNLEEYTEIIAYGNSKDDEAMFGIAHTIHRV